MNITDMNEAHQPPSPGGATAYSDTDIESCLVAYYLAEESYSHERIGEVTGLSRATIFRRLEHAKRNGWLETRQELVCPLALRRLCQGRLRDYRLEERLVEHLRTYGLRAAIVAADSEMPNEKDDQIVQRIGSLAAKRLSSVLDTGRHTVGINWGWATQMTVEGLQRVAGANEYITFVPLMGNLALDEKTTAYEEAQQCSANRLARLASEAFGAPSPRRLTTPAIIPERFSRDGMEVQLDAVWDFINDDISYQRVFGDRHHQLAAGKENVPGGARQRDTSLLGATQIIVTGMSALTKQSSLVYLAKLVLPGSDELETLTRGGYVGDLGGHPIADPVNAGVDPRASELARKVSSLVISPTPADFVRVAEKARRSRDNRRGVFMIGCGPKKGTAFLAAIRMRAVNELFTDRKTALEMLRDLEPPGG